ncbi:hypothetical protein QFZ37_000684 [Chryseobacterium ginsenosidimutans]|uniref:energy transducer TonB n=1 Tax=Chryseobacterium ginsenosidimutans TaxID=687846 RepID=UPI002786A951|nr:energy transducer TonB [Chryseobacterium ginsenosidimutans]MDQ0592315.1 hypothetical protein [Chryseobacterium ginsenosidimutans]
MKKIGIFFCLVFCCFIFAQESIQGPTDLNELVLKGKNGRILIEAEKPAAFPLGATVFKDKIIKNFKSRKIISKAETESCEITFVIDKEGNMTDVEAFGSNESFNDEAVRAVSKITQKWIPAEMNREKVRYRFRIPLTLTFNKK